MLPGFEAITDWVDYLFSFKGRIVEIGCLRGTAGSNRFGPDPFGSPDNEVAMVFE